MKFSGKTQGFLACNVAGIIQLLVVVENGSEVLCRRICVQCTSYCMVWLSALNLRTWVVLLSCLHLEVSGGETQATKIVATKAMLCVNLSQRKGQCPFRCFFFLLSSALA